MMIDDNYKPVILVVGAGGVGAYFSGRLAQNGADVSVVCRSDYNTVKQSGFDIKSVNGDFNFRPTEVLQSVEAFDKKADYVFVTTKVLPNSNMAQLISPAVHEKTTIVLIQNGIDIEGEFRERFPENELISGIAYIGVFREGNGKIRHQAGGRLSLGIYPKGSSTKLEYLVEAFRKSNVECEIREDIVKRRWEKLIWNVPFNALSVLGGCLTTQEIMNDKKLVELAENLMWDVVKAAKSCGIILEDTIVQENLDFTSAFPAYRTSMLLDYENGRPMEVDAIIGNVVKLAQQNNVSLPYIESIYALLQAVNKKN